MPIQIQATKVFYRNFNSTAKIVLNRGGSRSSKSYSILQVLVYKFLTEQAKKILIVRKTFPSLKMSTYHDFKKILEELGMLHKVKEDKKFCNFVYKDNYLQFCPVDDVEKIKSTSWNYIFMEEATEFDYNDFVLLKIRLSAPSVDGKLNQMFLAFNPIDENHWLKTKVLDKEKDVEEIHSTYLDNPFLSEDYRKLLESLAEQDPNYYRIYVLGEWGKYENLIFDNWKTIPAIPEEDVLDVFYGLDFGYNSPTALVKIATSKTDNKILYVSELLYQEKMTNSDLIEKLNILIPKKHETIIADSSEPDRIKEIRQAGFNCRLSKKGIKDSIDAVKKYQLLIDEKSVNLLKEIRAYCWKTDRNGNVLDKPIEINDHAISALRYAIYTYKGRGSIKVSLI